MTGKVPVREIISHPEPRSQKYDGINCPKCGATGQDIRAESRSYETNAGKRVPFEKLICEECGAAWTGGVCSCGSAGQ